MYLDMVLDNCPWMRKLQSRSGKKIIVNVNDSLKQIDLTIQFWSIYILLGI